MMTTTHRNRVHDKERNHEPSGPSCPDDPCDQRLSQHFSLKTITETRFAVTITGATGISISDAKLSIDLDMPDMPMPPNHPAATWQDGAYRGTAIFTMAGAWQMTVHIQRPGYDQEQVIFQIDQVQMK